MIESPDDQHDDETYQTWRPRRGPLTKLVVWLILLVFFLCVGVMIYAIIDGAIG